ncbi:MAG: hypothetical protein GX130_02220 [Candidatus Hydrogenedens sp.]|jgi:uncharacterized membrane protein|nr:hypothetical protein [Candidatus Hydrogenedens sp.]
MKHLKVMTQPRKAMSTSQILITIGSILSGIGGILITVANSLSGSKTVG